MRIDLLARRMAARFAQIVCGKVPERFELAKLSIAQGQIAARQVQTLEKVRTLADAEFSIFSQWGEDGIIEWLVHHNGDMPETFVEFGVENYLESNTRFLISNRNWRGLVIDGSPANIDVVKNDVISWRHDLTAIAAYINKENINELIASAGFDGEIGILSVDIDGNDYWVWQAIRQANPHIVIVEYNATFGDLFDLVIPYDPLFVRGKGHYSNLYYGASIGAVTRLGIVKGYTLLGSNRAGSNAFFIRNDRAPAFLARITDTTARPSRFREARDAAGKLTFLRGRAKMAEIGECTVVDVASNRVGPLASFGELYSAHWAAEIE